MNKCLFIFLLMLAFQHVETFAEEDPLNILKDSKFSDVSSKAWNYGRFERVESSFKKGDWMAQIKTERAAPPHGFFGSLVQTVRNPSAGTYILSGCFRGKNLSAFYVVVQFKPEKAREKRLFLLPRKFEKTKDPDWKRFVFPVTVPEKQSELTLIVQMFTQEKGAVCAVDSITMIQQKD